MTFDEYERNNKGVNMFTPIEDNDLVYRPVETTPPCIKIKRLNDDAKIPTRGSKYAAGYDLYADITSLDSPYYVDIVINAGDTMRIGTGVAVEIPDGYFGAVFARSGLATKQGLRPANCVGVIDSDYRGEIIVAIHNDSDTPSIISTGDRIAQLVIMPYLPVCFKEVDELSDTDRGEGGFGSTGVNDNK